MMYWSKGMSQEEIYEVSQLKRYLIADVFVAGKKLAFFEDKQDMLNKFCMWFDGQKNNKGQISKVVGLQRDTTQVGWVDLKVHYRVKSINVYIPKIEWVYKDNA